MEGMKTLWCVGGEEEVRSQHITERTKSAYCFRQFGGHKINISKHNGKCGRIGILLLYTVIQLIFISNNKERNHGKAYGDKTANLIAAAPQST